MQDCRFLKHKDKIMAATRQDPQHVLFHSRSGAQQQEDKTTNHTLHQMLQLAKEVKELTIQRDAIQAKLDTATKQLNSIRYDRQLANLLEEKTKNQVSCELDIEKQEVNIFFNTQDEEQTTKFLKQFLNDDNIKSVALSSQSPLYFSNNYRESIHAVLSLSARDTLIEGVAKMPSPMVLSPMPAEALDAPRMRC